MHKSEKKKNTFEDLRTMGNILESIPGHPIWYQQKRGTFTKKHEKLL